MDPIPIVSKVDAAVKKLMTAAERRYEIHLLAKVNVLETAKAVGELLLQAKAQVPHGQWGATFKKHCTRFSERQAQRHMRIAENWPRLSKVLERSNPPQTSYLTIDKALAELIADDAEPETTPEDTSDEPTTEGDEPAERPAPADPEPDADSEAEPEAEAESAEPEPLPDPRDELISEIQKLCHTLDAAKAKTIEVAATPWGHHIHTESVVSQLTAARGALWQSRPTEACNCVAGGREANPKCAACLGTGYTIRCRVLRGNRK